MTAPATPAWLKNLWVCAAVAFIVTSSTSQIAPIMPLYIAELGVTDIDELARWSGFIYSCTFISMAVCSPIWGALADRRGRKLMVLRALGWIVICMFLMAMATSVYQLAALRLLQGALSGFQGALFPLVMAMAPKGRGGWAMSVLVTGLVCGQLIGPVYGGWLGGIVGYRGLFFVMAGHALAGFCLVLALVHEEFAPPVRREHTRFLENFVFPVSRPLVLLFVTTFAAQYALMSVAPIITVYVQTLEPDTRHLGLIAGAVFSSAGVASMIFATRIGRYLDAHGPAVVLPFCLLASGLLCMPQALVGSAAALGMLRFVFGFTSVGILPAINALVKMHCRPDSLSRVYSANLSFQSLGIFCGTALGGAMAGAHSVESVFVCSGAVLIAVAVLFFWLFPRRED